MPDYDGIRVKRNLTALVEFSRIINSSLDLEFILNNVLLTCLGKFLATKGLIILKENDLFVIKSSKGFSTEIIETFPELRVNKECTGEDELNKFIEKSHLIVSEKINSSTECLGMVCLGTKLNNKPYSEDDIDFLKTILNISATAIQNSLVVAEIKKVNRMLDSKVQRLNSLFELSKEFGLFSESSKVARLLVLSLIGQFMVSKFSVLNFEGDTIQILDSKFPVDDLLGRLRKYEYFKIDSSQKIEKIKENFPLLFEIGVNLIVPMQIQGKVKGLIILGKRINDQDYADADIEFIYSVGSLAIISLENKRLFKEALEKLKLEEELEFAREIQQNLLPSSIPQTKSFEISALNLPSKQVGGDYYDIIKLDEKNYYIAIADVSGKGIPASLLMANMQAFLQVLCRQNLKIDEATGLINDLITSNTSDGRFITFFWAMLNDAEKKITYVNAGHNPPLLIRNGLIKKLGEGGMILGVMKTIMPYNATTVQLESGDLIIMFTDGISEAMSAENEEFSDVRLEEMVLKFHKHSADEVVKSIKTEVQNFTEGAPQSDDITLMAIKVK